MSKWWYIVCNGEIVFSGTKKECERIIRKDRTGELELYHESGRVKNED